MFEKYQPPRSYGSSGGALSLTGLESMSAAEKTARIMAVANDMAASIIYIAKQAEAGNLTNRQIIPIYNFIDSILGLERSQTKSLMRELDKQGSRIALMEKQHSRDIEELTKCAMETITQMKVRIAQLEKNSTKRWKQKEEEELVGDKETLLGGAQEVRRQLGIARRWLARRGRGEEFYLGISSGRRPQKEKRSRGRQRQRRWNQVEIILFQSTPYLSSVSAVSVSDQHSSFIQRSCASIFHTADSMSSKGDFAAVRRDIAAQMKQPGYDDGSAGPVFVRLAWHSAGTYDIESDTGGSNGAGMRYEAEGGDPANAGLQHGRAFLEPIKAKHPWITYSDLWTLAGVVAIKEMGGPEISWLPGRTDFVDDSKVPPRGRLPDATKGSDHIRHIFYRMGFNDQEIVALSGAHNLGRTHMDRSGFEGPWVNNPTRFSNQYFRLLKKLEWKPRTLSNGTKQFNYVDEDVPEEEREEPLMMLPTDMALLSDPEFAMWVDKYAEDKELFFDHFSKAFHKLMELGIKRNAQGEVINTDNVRGGYISAPKKSDRPTAPDQAPRAHL
ncbi:bifunctional catalase-peroxidase Cat2 [Trichophyton verrucosum HKI 0517]|nr:bifunctional catalase-peroxidase Cat2 [Trichophyton verrucosum HKI 0517]EFE39699.1 bifunctional catalase-peroxidase Cat2 [Trichophyton verrucosum HKI 0517]